MNFINPQMEMTMSSYFRRGLILIPIAAGIWIMNLYISSRRAFARVRRLYIHFEARLSDHVGV